MKTIKELADELGVSKQAVHARVNKEPLKSALEALENGIQTSARGTVHLSDEGADLVRSAYAEKYAPTLMRPAVSSNDQLIIQTLTEQLKVKDAQIAELQNRLKESIEVVLLTQIQNTVTDAIKTAMHSQQNIIEAPEMPKIPEPPEAPPPKPTEIPEKYPPVSFDRSHQSITLPPYPAQ